MQRLLFLIHKSISAGLHPLKTHVRGPQTWNVFKALSAVQSDFPSEFHQFSLVSCEHRLPQIIPARQCFSDQADMAEQRFLVEYAKRGTAGCKKCKDKIAKGIVRIGKVVPNPFSESAGEMKEWYHVKCIFEKLERARATTKKIEDLTELEGWEELLDEDKELINKHVSGTVQVFIQQQQNCSFDLQYQHCHGSSQRTHNTMMNVQSTSQMFTSQDEEISGVKSFCCQIQTDKEKLAETRCVCGEGPSRETTPTEVVQVTSACWPRCFELPDQSPTAERHRHTHTPP